MAHESRLTDNEWMRAVLAALFETIARDEALRLLRDGAARSALQNELNGVFRDRGVGVRVPADERGANLFHALLALRARFSPEEAHAKLELNLAMRGGRS